MKKCKDIIDELKDEIKKLGIQQGNPDLASPFKAGQMLGMQYAITLLENHSR